MAQEAVMDLSDKRIVVTGGIVWDTTKPNGQPRRCLDTTRAWKRLGFRAKTDFREGLRRTIDWYRTQCTSTTKCWRPRVLLSPRMTCQMPQLKYDPGVGRLKRRRKSSL